MSFIKKFLKKDSKEFEYNGIIPKDIMNTIINISDVNVIFNLMRTSKAIKKLCDEVYEKKIIKIFPELLKLKIEKGLIFKKEILGVQKFCMIKKNTFIGKYKNKNLLDINGNNVKIYKTKFVYTLIPEVFKLKISMFKNKTFIEWGYHIIFEKTIFLNEIQGDYNSYGLVEGVNYIFDLENISNELELSPYIL